MNLSSSSGKDTIMDTVNEAIGNKQIERLHLTNLLSASMMLEALVDGLSGR